MQSIQEVESFRNLHGLSYEDLSEYLEIPKKKLIKMLNEEEKLPKLMSLALRTLESDLNSAKTLQANFDDHSFTFIDLFAGIGGMRLGFEKAGGKCIFTSEWDKFPAKMYEDNFNERPSGDITKIKVEDIPKHDILIAGFPCQPFSLAGVSKKNSMGRSHGFACKTQGTLFFDVARILEYHQPKMFLLENVKNLKSHDNGNTFKVIMETLEKELGYTVSEKIIDGGLLVPQHRERIYIVGTRSKTPFVFPTINPVQRTLKDILDTNVDSKYTLTDGLWNSLKNHAAKHKAKGNGFGFGLNTPEDRSRTLSARYYKDGAEILIEQKGKNPRRLTPRECARLMGFPNKFKITLSDIRAYKSFGNSVVVPIIERLAFAMAETDIIKSRTMHKSNSKMLS